VEQSPIMQSMLQSYERTQAELERKEQEASRLMAPRKSQRKVQFQTPGSHAVPPAAKSSAKPSAASSASSAPSAAQYVPPPSFLQTMTHPSSSLPSFSSVPDYFNR
jgi:hypothetical protein